MTTERPHRWSDEQLNALVDGELSPADAAALLEQWSAEPALRDRIGQLRLAKELVQHAYAGVAPTPPQHSAAPRPRARLAAAALVLFAGGLVAGWMAREGAVGPTAWTSARVDTQAPASETSHVVVHVSHNDPRQWQAALERTQGLIDATRGSGRTVAIEIVANGPGLDLLRASDSPYAQRLESLRTAYPPLALVACGQTLQKLQDAGVEVRLLPGTRVATSALDEIVLRMQQGWAYVRL